MPAQAVNLLVFREDRRRVSGHGLKAALLIDVQSFSPEAELRALLRAGELECGVADAAPELAAAWELVTDNLADTALSPESLSLNASCTLVRQAEVPPYVHVSSPEGFAYYGLHPLAYAEVAGRLGPLPQTVGVIGIRSIGSTLSAVTAAALRLRGTRASRTTVRPEGHPYNRRTLLTPRQLAGIRELLRRGAAFLVVDEGPGLSGSSLLSVAEALVEAGAPAETIVLICGHEPKFAAMCSDDAQRRASRFRWVAVDRQPRVPEGAQVFVGGGEWRRWLYGDEQDWPASWTTLERLKYLSHEEQVEKRLYKFSGFGHYGDQAIEREQEAATAGFAPTPERVEQGFACYRWLHGRPMRAGDLSERALARLAEYCAFRARAFRSGEADLRPLQQMAEHNLDQLGFDLKVKLRVERPVIADGRMQPHEWLLASDGQMLKTDSGSHGDDHFFPGRTDVAWDLAGAIVEWRMDPGQTEFFLENYRSASGDDAGSRIRGFVTVYTAFRCAYCLMAANALHGNAEEARLRRAANRYLSLLSSHVLDGQAFRALLESPAA